MSMKKLSQKLRGEHPLQYVLRQAQQVWPQITMEKLQEELEQICQTVLLYPAQGKGPYRTATVLSCESLIQKSLAEALGLDKLCSTQRR
jgi:hypothetical protein